MPLFKKLEVPQELPDLSKKWGNSQQKPSNLLSEKPDQIQSQIQQSPVESMEIDQSFFQDLLQKLESNNPNDLEELRYHFSNNLLSEMKEYWNKQKLILGPSKDLKRKLVEKISNMQTLEKEWQQTYFSLMEKEEKIKQEEIELKNYLNEFMRIHREQQENY